MKDSIKYIIMVVLVFGLGTAVYFFDSDEGDDDCSQRSCDNDEGDDLQPEKAAMVMKVTTCSQELRW